MFGYRALSLLRTTGVVCTIATINDSWWIKNRTVMCRYGSHITHTAISYLNSAPIKNLWNKCVGGNVHVKDLKRLYQY